MIVVTIMPVVNAKARAKTTKITFMTRAFCIGLLSMAEPAGCSVTGITEHRFSPDIGGVSSVIFPNLPGPPASLLALWDF
jgi:hypothetical protein